MVMVWKGAAAEPVDVNAEEANAAARWFVVRMFDGRTGAQGMQIVAAKDERAALLEIAYDGRTFTELRIAEVMESGARRQLGSKTRARAHFRAESKRSEP